MPRLIIAIGFQRADLRSLVTPRFKLKQIEEAYEPFTNQRGGVLKVAIPSSAARSPDLLGVSGW